MCFRLLAKVLDSSMQKGWREGELHYASFSSSVNVILFAIICKILVNLATSFNSKVVMIILSWNCNLSRVQQWLCLEFEPFCGCVCSRVVSLTDEQLWLPRDGFEAEPVGSPDGRAPVLRGGGGCPVRPRRGVPAPLHGPHRGHPMVSCTWEIVQMISAIVNSTSVTASIKNSFNKFSASGN